MGRDIVLFTTVILLAVCTLGQVSAGAGHRGPVQEVTPANDTFMSSQGRLANAADSDVALATYEGRVYAFWSSKKDTDTIMVAKHDARKGGWTDRGEVLPRDDVQDNDPAAIGFQGRLFVAWVRGNAATDIYYSSYNGTEGVWTGAGKVYSGLDTVMGFDHSPTFGVFNGRLYLAWATTNQVLGFDTDENIVVCEWDGDFDCEKDQVRIPSLGNPIVNGPDHDPTMEVFDGRLWLAWSSRDAHVTTGSDYDIVVSNFDGATWSGPVEVSTDEPPVTGGWMPDDRRPDLQASGGMLFIAWEGPGNLDAQERDVLVSSIADREGTWEGPREISINGNGAYDEAPVMASLDGTLYVIWSTNDADVTHRTDLDLVIRGYDEVGGWGGIEEISDADDSDARDDQPTVLAVDEGNGMRLMIAWRVEHQVDVDIYSRTFSHDAEKGVGDLVWSICGIMLIATLILAPTTLFPRSKVPGPEGPPKRSKK